MFIFLRAIAVMNTLHFRKPCGFLLYSIFTQLKKQQKKQNCLLQKCLSPEAPKLYMAENCRIIGSLIIGPTVKTTPGEINGALLAKLSSSNEFLHYSSKLQLIRLTNNHHTCMVSCKRMIILAYSNHSCIMPAALGNNID